MRPLIIAHRGASGYRPEHTLASYELAARLGADYLEPDLVSTADGVLVARHEPEIGSTTDIATRPEFADRRTTKVIDGEEHTGWFVEDLTSTEVKTLRAVERIPAVRQQNTIYNGRFGVPTFGDILALRERLSAELGREIGVYPETKHPSYFAGLGRPLEPALIAALDAAGLNQAGAPVFVQSFETANLQALHTQLRVPLVQLIADRGAPADLGTNADRGAPADLGPPQRARAISDRQPGDRQPGDLAALRTYADLCTPAGLAWIAGYADAVGPNKELVIPGDRFPEPTTLVADAHAAGLAVHPYTFRNENRFLPRHLRHTGKGARYGDAFTEYEAFLRAGVDGVFTDHPDTAATARADLLIATA